MVYEMVRDGKARRFCGPGPDQVVRVVFREPHELWQRDFGAPWLVGDRKLVRLLDTGMAAEEDLDELVEQTGDKTSRIDLLDEVSKLVPGEAAEVFYVAGDGRTMGRRILARVE